MGKQPNRRGVCRAIYYSLLAMRRRWYLRARKWKSLSDSIDVCDSSLAVVGNGPSILESEEGHLVDSHDIVIRFNNYSTTGGYRRFVGRRTDAWATNCFYDIGMPNPVPPIVLCPLPITRKPGFTYKHYRVNDWLLQNTKDYTFLIPLDLFASLEERCPNPSTGIALIYWLYHLRGHSLRNIHLYGFDFFSSAAHHYYRVEGRRDHDGDLERMLFDQMRQGAL